MFGVKTNQRHSIACHKAFSISFFRAFFESFVFFCYCCCCFCCLHTFWLVCAMWRTMTTVIKMQTKPSNAFVWEPQSKSSLSLSHPLSLSSLLTALKWQWQWADTIHTGKPTTVRSKTTIFVASGHQLHVHSVQIYHIDGHITNVQLFGIHQF